MGISPPQYHCRGIHIVRLSLEMRLGVECEGWYTVRETLSVWSWCGILCDHCVCWQCISLAEASPTYGCRGNLMRCWVADALDQGSRQVVWVHSLSANSCLSLVKNISIWSQKERCLCMCVLLQGLILYFLGNMVSIVGYCLIPTRGHRFSIPFWMIEIGSKPWATPSLPHMLHFLQNVSWSIMICFDATADVTAAVTDLTNTGWRAAIMVAIRSSIIAPSCVGAPWPSISSAASCLLFFCQFHYWLQPQLPPLSSFRTTNLHRHFV